MYWRTTDRNLSTWIDKKYIQQFMFELLEPPVYAMSFLEREGMERLRKRELELMRRFYNGVAEIPNVKVYGDFRTDRRAAIVSLNIGDYDSAEISDELSGRYGIVTRSGAHCAPLMHEALGTKIQGAVRFSFSHYNTEEEIDEAIRAVKELAEE